MRNAERFTAFREMSFYITPFIAKILTMHLNRWKILILQSTMLFEIFKFVVPSDDVSKFFSIFNLNVDASFVVIGAYC